FPDVVVSPACGHRDCRLGRYFSGHRAETDAGLARGDGNWYPCVFGAGAVRAPMAISGGRLKRAAVRILIGVFSAVAAVIPTATSLSSQSLPSAVEAIDKARVGTRILFTTAHPDDEWSGLLAYLSHGLDADVGLLTVTRGQGGQN